MAVEVFANDALGTVTSGGTTAPAAGTVQTWLVTQTNPFAAASSSATPPTQFYVADTASAKETEKILVTNISGTSWTVTRGADGTTPVAHSSGFTIVQVETRASFEAFQSPDWLNVVTQFGADPTGASDSTSAFQAACDAAVGAGGGVVYFPTGTYKQDGEVTVSLDTTAVRIAGAGKWATRILYYGSEAAWTIYDASLYSDSGVLQGGGGGLTGVTFDGTNAGSGSVLVQAGDVFQWEIDVAVVSGADTSVTTGVHFYNQYFWAEQMHGRVYTQNCTPGVLFDNGGDAGGNSFDRSILDLFIDQDNPNFDGVVFDNGALLVDGRLGIYGNFSLAESSVSSAVLRLEGSGGGAYSSITDSVLNIGVEVGGTGTYAPQTIKFGSGSNNIGTCTGLLHFLADNPSYPFTASNNTGQFAFQGRVSGDSTLTPRYVYGALAQSVASNATLDASIASVVACTPAANLTGLIMATVSSEGTVVTIINKSAYTMTFAASGSNVADGSSDVIAAYTARQFVWDTSTSLWYRMG